MGQLVLLYWGCVLLMYLSQVYYPTRVSIGGKSHEKQHFMLQKTDIFMVAAIIWLTCFAFLRESYNDTGTYIRMFSSAPTLTEYIADNGIIRFGGNHLSYVYQSFMHDLTDNYHIYFFFPNLFSSIAIVKFFKRYSVDSTLSILMYFSVGTYVMYMAALKQNIAMFFLLMSIPYLERKKYIRFYLLVLIAVMFHTHAFVFMFIPLICGKPWGKRIWIVLFATLFAIATYNYTLGAFMNFAESIGAFVAEVEVFDGHSINEIRVIVYWVPAFLALIFRRRLFSDSTRMENLVINLSCVSAFVLTIGIAEGANLYGRMAAYFEIFSAVSLPWMIKKLFTERSAKFITISAMLLYFVYFIYEYTISKPFGSEYYAISLFQFLRSLFI